MSYRDARRGALTAGAVLLLMPVLEVALGLGNAGPVHFLVASFGVALLALSRNFR
jgi:hypothetical protein